MNYEQARQVDPNADRPDAGKWRWTTANDGRVRPAGSCSPLTTCTECKGWSGIIRPDVDCQHCGNRGLVDVQNPCPGHDTAEEAAEHYRQHRIDNVRFRTLDNPNALHKCRVNDCGAFTAGVMEIEGDGYFMETVCERHQTRETAEALIGRVTSVMHS